jgi:hypothetical protein
MPKIFFLCYQVILENELKRKLQPGVKLKNLAVTIVDEETDDQSSDIVVIVSSDEEDGRTSSAQEEDVEEIVEVAITSSDSEEEVGVIANGVNGCHKVQDVDVKPSRSFLKAAHTMSQDLQAKYFPHS